MKILIPTTGFGKSGGHRVLSKMADQMIINDFDVSFIVPEKHSMPYYKTNAAIIKTKSSNSKCKLLNFFSMLYSLYKELCKFPGSKVIASHHIMAYLAFFLPKKFDKYYYIQAYEVKLESKLFRKFIAYLTYFFPLKKIVNSKKLLPEYLNKFIAVVPAGVDLDLFKGSITPLSGETINIGLIGRKEPYKGTKEIIKALEIVQNELHKKLIINIAIHEPNIPVTLKESVKFFDVKSDDELASFYNLNDILVATGLIEHGAFHYPCAEAMACGRIVISNYAPLKETSSQLFLKATTVESLVEKIREAIDYDKAKVLKELAENRSVLKKYSWEKVGDLMSSTLEK